MPPWPIAMPSSTAIVLNSRGMPPAARDRLGDDPADRLRGGCGPGTNSVKELATAMIGLPMSALGYAGGAHKGAGARHVAAVGDCAGPQLGHRRSLLQRVSETV